MSIVLQKCYLNYLYFRHCPALPEGNLAKTFLEAFTNAIKLKIPNKTFPWPYMFSTQYP